MGYDFFRNSECECFPCHETRRPERFNCLFCYCPLYTYDRCGGSYTLTDKGLKDCSDCLFPHESYVGVLEKLRSMKG